MKNKKTLFKHQIIVTSILVFAVVISMVGGSFALFSNSSASGEYNIIKAGDLEVSYVEGGDGAVSVLSLNGAYPMSDTNGANQTPYRFNVTNTGSIPLNYRIKIENDEAIIAEDGCQNNLLSQEYVKYKFDNDSPVLLSSKESSSYTIYDSSEDENTTALQPGSSKIHEVRLWIKEDAPNEVLGSHFHGKVVIEVVQTGVDQKLTQEYAIGDTVNLLDNSSWYVLKNSSMTDSTVTLIARDNITLDGNTTVAFDTEGNTNYDNSTLKALIDENYASVLETSLINAGGTKDYFEVSIPTMEDIASAYSKTFNQSIIDFTDAKAFLTSSTYWTKTVASNFENSVWYISGSNKKSGVQLVTDTTIGVRPVIVTSKLNIK